MRYLPFGMNPNMYISLWIIFSIFLLLTGFWKLLIRREYKKFIISALVLLGLSGLTWIDFYFALKQQTFEQKLWVVGPGLFLFMVLIFSGFFMSKYVHDKNLGSPEPLQGNRLLSASKLRLFGIISIIVALGSWSYGLIFPIRSKNLLIVGVALYLYLLLFGINILAKKNR